MSGRSCWLAIPILLAMAPATWPQERAAARTSAADLRQRAAAVNRQALRLAIEDLIASYGPRYPDGPRYLAKLAELERRWPQVEAGLARGDAPSQAAAEELVGLARTALLANPLLDDSTSPDGALRLLVVRRKANQLGLPQNWEGNSSLPRTGYDNQIGTLTKLRGAVESTPIVRPTGGRFVGDVDLHFDATKLLFSMPSEQGPWRVYEWDLAGGSSRLLPQIDEPDVDNYDACYLPNGKVVFTSTATFTGVPCVTGASHVANLYLTDRQGTIRRLTFEQDHDWCPTVLDDGRVLYLRWEYSDLPHFVSRILFTMNPDGTEQRAFYGSNSYWPNALFYARPIPQRPTQFVAVVGGHHDVPRMGELVVFDTARGQFEADGVVQRIPGRGQRVQAVLRDDLVRDRWPKFLHPWPLSDKYFLVSAQLTDESPWGVYLVDVFDNLTLLFAEPGYAFLEPVPLRARPAPPAIAERVQPGRKDALVHLSDVYSGEGLAGVPRGTVKQLRVFGYEFAYHGMGGQVNRVGLDGPWDVKRILGTVPVEPDGSAYFRVPANTPIAVQPLDEAGQALQLMRSWLTAMPGETVSCVGCHDRSHRASQAARHDLALSRPPAEIAPWHGPPRGFGFLREVQPVLDRHCVRCHDGRGPDRGGAAPDFRRLPAVHLAATDANYVSGTFPPSYVALRQFVRAATIESDMHLLTPAEFHAETTRLVRLLKKGHYGVSLTAQEWSRIVTWIDLNTPAHGSWREIVGPGKTSLQLERRRQMNRLYANLNDDPEEPADPEAPSEPPSPAPATGANGSAVSRAALRAAADASAPAAPATRTVDLGGGVTLALARLPAGSFQMGDDQGHPDERPAHRVDIQEAFWIGACEVTNRQFARFDPRHDSRLETGDFLQFNEPERGDAANLPDQPVCRVSWRDAMAFCRWLSARSGESFTLPSEAQWEYACRAGSASAMSYGPAEADFAARANLADRQLRQVRTFTWNLPSGAVPPWRPAIDEVDDGHRVSALVGRYAPNAWGLFDLHGNVAEWTASSFRAYPYHDADGRNDPAGDERRVVRGGSWYDRPQDARSAYRWHYPPWQKVFDVGFRVVARAK